MYQLKHTQIVKLSRAQTDHHQNHIDSHFTTTSIRYLESLESVLGPDQIPTFSVSRWQGSGSYWPYSKGHRVKLSDHDWATVKRHKYSVCAGIKINQAIHKLLDILVQDSSQPEVVENTVRLLLTLMLRNSKHHLILKGFNRRARLCHTCDANHDCVWPRY